MRHFLLLALLFSFTSAAAAPIKENAPPKDFYILTIAKGGTGLINKLMRILTKRETCVAPNQTFKKHTHLAGIADITRYFNAQEYPFRHFLPFNSLYEEVHSLYPNIVPIVHIRDLRDVCVALTFSSSKELDNLLGKDSSFDDRLMYVIQHSDSLRYHDCKRNGEYAVEWLNRKGTIVSRFEDLVGAKGGGSDEAQKDAIKRIAKALNIRVSNATWKQIDEKLFGGNATFRKGQIGEWKKHFNEEHKTAFKIAMGDILISLGYADDNEW